MRRSTVLAIGATALASMIALVPGSAGADSTPVEISDSRWRIELRAAVAATSAAAGREGMAATFSTSQFGTTTASSLVVDPARRITRFDSRSVLFQYHHRSLPYETGADPCNPTDPASSRSFREARTTITAAGIGSYRSLGSPTSTRFVRQGRRLAGVPQARWSLTPRESDPSRWTTEDALGDQINILGLVDRPDGEEFSVAKSALDGGGHRYHWEWASKGPLGSSRHESTVTTEVDGRLVRLVTQNRNDRNELIVKSDDLQYGPQRIALPADGSVITRGKLDRGCTAVVLREVVRTLPARAARALNRRTQPATPQQIQRALRNRVEHVGVRMRLKVVNRPDGAELVGRHPLVGKQASRVVVRDGRAVVRRVAGGPRGN